LIRVALFVKHGIGSRQIAGARLHNFSVFVTLLVAQQAFFKTQLPRIRPLESLPLISEFSVVSD
jgi:hypothetical protein